MLQVREAAAPLDRWQKSYQRFVQVPAGRGRQQRMGCTGLLQAHIPHARLAPAAAVGCESASECWWAELYNGFAQAASLLSQHQCAHRPPYHCAPARCARALAWWTAPASRARCASTCRRDTGAECVGSGVCVARIQGPLRS